MNDLRLRIWRAFAVLLAAATAVLLTVNVGASAEDREDDVVVRLRNEGRFAEAEDRGRQQLADASLDPRQRSQAAIELVRTITMHARAASGDEREKLWRDAADEVAQYARQHPRDPQLPIVRAQGALAIASEAQTRREEAQIVAGGEAAADDAFGPARLAARRAIKSWRQLREDVAVARRAAGSARSSDGRLTAAELTALDNHAAYQVALAHVNQAECFAYGSADQVGAIADASTLVEGLKGLPADDPVGWPSRALFVTCLRLLGKPAAAERVLSRLASEDPPAGVTAQLDAERIRIALALGQVQRAAQLASDAAPSDEPYAADLDHARLEALVAAWRDAAGRRLEAAASQWQTKIAEQLDRIDAGGSRYWLSQAERLLAKAAKSTPGEVADWLFERSARTAYLAGKPDEAIAAYDRAAAAARDHGQPDRAFELALAAGLIEHQRNRHAEAAARLARAALVRPQHSRAADAHALALSHAGPLAAQEPKTELPRYRQMLEEHLTRWPASQAAGQVSLWLGRVAVEQKDWPAAVKAWQAVPPDDPNFQRATIGAAQVLVERIDGGGHDAEELLLAALRHNDDVNSSDGGWPHTAHVALAVALAAQQKLDEAQRIADKLPTDPVCHRLRLAAQLQRVRVSDQQRAALGHLRAKALAPLVERRGQLSDAVRQ